MQKKKHYELITWIMMILFYGLNVTDELKYLVQVIQTFKDVFINTIDKTISVCGDLPKKINK